MESATGMRSSRSLSRSLVAITIADFSSPIGYEKENDNVLTKFEKPQVAVMTQSPAGPPSMTVCSRRARLGKLFCNVRDTNFFPYVFLEKKKQLNIIKEIKQIMAWR